MCGIGAVFSLIGRQVKQTDLNKMIGLLNHRGPDAYGSILSKGKNVGLAHVRLSVRDPIHGAQPMHDKETNTHITYAGEIYDCDRLRDQLSSKGHVFRNNSDTEVILKLYSEYGTSMFEYLNGEFSFVIWDERRNIMLSARDRFGIKPLFYYNTNDEIVFGSEAKALLGLGRVSSEISHNYLLTSFMGSFVGQESFYRDINAVKPGHYILVKDGAMIEVPYWQPNYTQKTNLSFEDAAEELNSLVNQAVKRRMVTDCKLGSFLSGGIDSTIVTACAAKHQTDIPTFSIGFKGHDFDESEVARDTANVLDIPFSCLLTSKEEMSRNLVSTLRHIELPISSPQPIGMTMLSKHVRNNGVKSCLTGEGADEIFGGYAYFKLDQLREQMRTGVLSKDEFMSLQSRFEALEKSNKVLLWFPCKKWNDYTYRGRYDSSYNVRYQHVSGLREKVFNDEVLASQPHASDLIEQLYSSLYEDQVNGIDFNRALSARQLSGYVFAMQGDRVQMSNAVEGRVPFLDNDVVKFAHSLPPEYLVDLRQLKEKRILHESFKDCVPAHMRNRHKQAYHSGLTWSDFVKTPEGRDMWEYYLGRSCVKNSGIFNASFVRLLKGLNKLAPSSSTMKLQTDLLLGSVFTTMVLKDIMQEKPLLANIETQTIGEPTASIAS